MSDIEGPLSGRAALITGANRGLGLEIARAYLRAGAAVFLSARDGNRLEGEVHALRGEHSGAEIGFAPGDVSREEDVKLVVAEALRRFPNLNILVNNAGVYGPIGPLESIDWSAWTEALAINLYGSVLMIRSLLPHFKAKRYGKIVQLSGGGATKPMPRFSAYAASKAAVVRLVETVADEARPFNIDANSIAPGAVNTGMLDEVLQAGPEIAGAQYYEQSVKQKETGGASPSEGAALAVFLASAASDGITGRLISALWDRYDEWPARWDEIAATDAYTLRRITGRDRGIAWGDR